VCIFLRKSNKKQLDREISKAEKNSTPIPGEQQRAMQEYVDKIVELLENTKKDETGVRFYIKDILWENNSKELPSQAFVDLWDSQGIADMSSFGKKLMKALGEKYDSKVLRANPDLTKIDLVTRE
jgi:hypothetical protein